MKYCRFLSIMMAAVLALLSLAACDNAGVGSESSSENTETEAPPESILLADLPNYVLVRPENSSDELTVMVTRFRTDLLEATGIESIKYKDDFYREGVASLEKGEFEILVGDTNREESQIFLSELRYKDYGYAVINNKIVIAGHNDEATQKAIDLFEEEVLNVKPEDETVFMYHETKKVEAEYATDNMTIGSIPVKGLKIVYPSKDKYAESDFAEAIADLLSEVSGYAVKAYSSKDAVYTDSDGIIIVGSLDDNRGITLPADLKPEESYIAVKDKTILVGGGASLGIYNAAAEFQKRIKDSEGKALTLSAEERITVSVDYIKAMSFNVYVGNRNETRIRRVITMIKNYMPDVFGVQEANPAWMTDLKNNLSAYAFVGNGRDGGSNGEYSAIFYLKDKFTVLESGTKWLSDTPDKVSKFSESSLNRILTYAVLKRNSDGKVFVHINTHFDHTNDTARAKQAGVLVEIAEQFKDYPILMTGDFNCNSSSSPYSKIISAGFKDSSTIAQTAVTGPTFHGYAGKESIIDFCFVTPGKINVLNYKVCNEKINDDFASDHHPVYIEFVY